jgi:hypothetical protein
VRQTQRQRQANDNALATGQVLRGPNLTRLVVLSSSG